MNTKRATINDVAELAGVSRAAVSKVLRNAYGISEQMRQSVEQAMAELQYRPQIAARGLRGRTYTLGVVMPDMRNPFFPDILDGVWAALRDTQYQPLLAVRPSDDATEKPLIDMMLDRKLDGFIMIAPIVRHDYLWSLAASSPVVVIGRHESGGSFDTVNNDDELGARLAVTHLIAQGHSRIAFFGFDSREDAAVNPVVFRQRGYEAAMREQGLAEHIACFSCRNWTDPEEGRAFTRQVLAGKNRPTAIFAWTDHVALTVTAAAHEMGLRLPEDLAVVGYDNSRVCSLPQIMLSSVDQDAQLLGATAAELLVERIEGRTEAVDFVTPPRLIARKSSLSAAGP